jgi:predicted nucleotidyltransferase
VIADERLLAVLERVVDGSNPQEAVTEWFPGDDLFAPASPRYISRMVDRPDFADRVLDALGRVFPAHRLLGVWLFGSQARGEATDRSDVDLAVLADARLDPLAVGAAASALERIAGARVDLVDLRAASGLLRVQATHEGRLIAAPDRFRAELFATHALSDFAAFGPNRRMCTEALKAKFRGR